MKYQRMAPGIFLDRPNRFIAHVQIDGKEETVHVKNTGRCRELLLPGAQVMLQLSDNPNRKTAWDLISVKRRGLAGSTWIPRRPTGWSGNFWKSSQALHIYGPSTGTGTREWIFTLSGLRQTGRTRAENSRQTARPGNHGNASWRSRELPWSGDGIAYFPDAPTERGVKHILELQRALAEGYDSYLAFVIQMEGITEVRPNDETHPAFGQVLREAAAAGVQVLCLPCAVKKDSLTVKEALPCGLSL